ncbi:MAG TPA: type II CAAX endopeptidase family protein [Bacteroidales bacterium]|nr:type II CAAX endopeptidase family protein [Bacteroidales bacterium]
MEISETTSAPVCGDDKFLTEPFKGKNAFWRYFVGAIIPFIASNLIGAIPLVVVMIVASGGDMMATRGGMPDFAAMGIDLNFGFFLMVFPFILAFLVFVYQVKPLHERSLRSVINGGKNIRWGRIFISAGVWTLISAFFLYFSIKADPGNFTLVNTSRSLLILAVLAVLLIPFQAGFEELLFRGYLMQGFAVLARNRWVPLVATSVLFGLMHALNPEVKGYGFLTMIPQYIFMGVIFAIPALMDDGIEVAIGAHVANNVFLSVFLTTKDSALQTPAMYEQINIYPWKDFGGLAIMAVIYLGAMALIYKWKDIRKLYGRINIAA